MPTNEELKDFAGRIWVSLVDDLYSKGLIDEERCNIPLLKEDEQFIQPIYLGMLGARPVKHVKEEIVLEVKEHTVKFNDKDVTIGMDTWMALVIMKNSNQAIDLRKFNEVADSLEIGTLTVKAMLSRWDELKELWGDEWK